MYYQEITDTIREPFIILNKDLYVVTANQAFYAMFKVLKTATEGKLIYELGNNQWQSAELRELLENILPKHKMMHDFEVTQDFPDLGPKTMLLNARQIDSKQLILLAIEDITERKQLQANSEQVTTNLRKQQRILEELNSVKDEFVSMASHQLRTPATIVKQYTAMLRDGYAGALSKSQIVMLDSAIVSNERQLIIIEDLLKVARADAGKVYLVKADSDAVELITGVIKDQLITFANRKQDIIFAEHSPEVIAYIDAKLMRMVLENLLDNASKYSRNGKTITVNLTQSAKYTTITVTDAGVGILKKDQKRLFQKFSRIDNPLTVSRVGTGLGLYWVKKIVDLHGGSIEMFSNAKHGSVFAVTIPNNNEEIDTGGAALLV